MRLLVVHYDATLRLGVRSALDTRKYQVDEAEDGEQAVAMVLEKGPYDGVILDVNMPKMSGLDALAKIKDHNPSTFCIVRTAFTNIQDAVRATKLGAFDYIEKPIDGDRLLQV